MARTLKKLEGNMLIAQSGGPTSVINQSLIGAIQEAKKYGAIQRIYGARHGIQGILDEDFIDLTRERETTLEAVAVTPSSMLGSVRKKPTAADCKQIFEVMRRYGIRYFFYIGGNDSAETTHIINEQARGSRYEFRCFHICKTIDNDLLENDHTPGFGSGARFVASAFMGDNLDNRALLGIKINIVMGRHAGFLTAASALARQYPDDGPHLVYLPERPFSIQRFIRDIKQVMATHGRCVVAVSEGIADGKGTPILSKFSQSKEIDDHGNVQLSGTGALGDLLAGGGAERHHDHPSAGGYLRLPAAFIRRYLLGGGRERGTGGGPRGCSLRGSRMGTWQRGDQTETRTEISGPLRPGAPKEGGQGHPPHAGCLYQCRGEPCHPGIH